MKKWTAFFLALLICLLPVSAVAASPCDNGHTAGSTLHDPTYADCSGGFKSAWYVCSVCGCAVDADGNDVPWYPAASQHDLVKIPYTPPPTPPTATRPTGSAASVTSVSLMRTVRI